MPFLPNPSLAWQPLADPVQAARIEGVLEEIAETLWERRQELNPSLFSGLAGAALFLGHYGRRPGFGLHAERSMDLIQAAIDRVEEVPSPQLYQGYPGLGWCVQHLRSLLPLDLDEDPDSDLDEVVLELLDVEPWKGSYDLMGGLVGLGVYALERLPLPEARSIVALIVHHLETLAIPVPQGRVWRVPVAELPDYQQEICPQGYLNFGLAHGVPGVLLFLAEARSHGIESARAERLIAQGLAGLRGYLQEGSAGALLPAWCPWGVARPEPTHSRLAWCNGEFGASMALWLVAEKSGYPRWRAWALDMARMAAERPRAESGVRDAGLCHGSAGNLHLFNRWFQASGDPAFRTAALACLDQTLAFRDPARGFAGFWALALETEAHPHAYDPAPGLMEGAAGVGLALLSCLPEADPSWDRFLMLSTRGPA